MSATPVPLRLLTFSKPAAPPPDALERLKRVNPAAYRDLVTMAELLLNKVNGGAR